MADIISAGSTASRSNEFVDPYDFHAYDGVYGGLNAAEAGYDDDTYGDKWISSGNSIGEKFTDWLGITDYKGNYENWKAERDRKYERASVVSARAWDKYLQDTKYQRTVADLKAAGLNPWLAVQNGLNAGSAGTTASTGGTPTAKQSQRDDHSALGALIIALGRVIAAGL